MGMSPRRREPRLRTLSRPVALLVAFALLAAFVSVAPAAGSGVISGTVYQPNGVTRASGITVRLYKTSSPLSPYLVRTTAADGTYSFTGLINTSYFVEFFDGTGTYLTEYWNDKPTKSAADPIVLGDGELRSGTDATMGHACTIAGVVRDAAGNGIAGVTVNAYRHQGGTSFDTTTTATTSSGAGGVYSLGGLPSGSYGLQFFSDTFAAHYHSDDPTSGVTALSRATPVTVTSGRLEGVDEVMFQWGGIDGTVNGASGALSNVSVASYRYEAGQWVQQFGGMGPPTDGAGKFVARPLYPGRYRLLFSDGALVYPAQYHLSALTAALARDVTVSDGATTTLSTTLVAADSAPPVSTVHDIPAGWSNSVTPSITSTDGVSGSGVAAIRYRVGSGADTTYTAPFAVTSEGEQTLYYWAIDGFGNTETAKTATVRTDFTAPAAPGPITVDPAGWSAAASYLLTWTNPDQTGASPIVGKYYKVGSAPTSPTDGTYVAGAASSLTVDSPGEGSHTVHVWLRDEAGNADHANARSATIMVDSGPPAAPGPITVAPSGWSNASSFSLSWTNPSESGSPIAGKYYKLDSVPTGPTDGTYVAGGAGSLSVPAPADGSHTVYVWLVDEAGRVDEGNRTSATILPDRTAPAAPTGLAPSAPGTPGPVSFVWTNPGQSGVSPIAGKFYKLDAPPDHSTDGTYVAGAGASLAGIDPGADGAHTLYVWLRDEAANAGAAASTTFTYQAVSLVTSPVFRFYNKRTGTHFYTIDAGEAATVAATLSWLYNAEGPAYNACPTPQTGMIPLFRFYNKRTGTHFYTADPAEQQRVATTLSAIYAYEGPAYYVAAAEGPSTTAVHRFYNRLAGVHFYTADPSEQQRVAQTLFSIYNYEGVGFHVPR